MSGEPEVLFDDRFPIEYGQFYVRWGDPAADGMEEAFVGQANGLIGAVVPGQLFCLTGLNRGWVGLTIRWHSTEPPIEDDWEDVVEVSADLTASPRLLPWDQASMPQDAVELPLPPGPHRIRYGVRGMDEASAVGVGPSIDAGGRVYDHYLLDLWPAAPAADAVVRRTSRAAAYWHRELGRREPLVLDRLSIAVAGPPYGRPANRYVLTCLATGDQLTIVGRPGEDLADEIRVGDCLLRAIRVSATTELGGEVPGGTCLVYDERPAGGVHLFSGDLLDPGSTLPRRDLLRAELQARLFSVLPEDTRVHPASGEDRSLAEARVQLDSTTDVDAGDWVPASEIGLGD